MQMSQTEALSFIGSLLMRMMGVLLVVADSVVIGEKQRAYITRQREWYEQQQDMMNAAEQVDELMGESDVGAANPDHLPVDMASKTVDVPSVARRDACMAGAGREGLPQALRQGRAEG